MPMKKLEEIHLLNKVLVLSLGFLILLFGSYYLGKKIRNRNSDTMIFTKGSSPVSHIPEKIPEEETPPTEWEDVKPVENFDWNVPALFELPSGQSWEIVNPDSLERPISTTIYIRGTGQISLPGTLYWSGTFKYNSPGYNPFAKFVESLDKDWKPGLTYKGEEICGIDGGSGGSSVYSVVKMNGPFIRTIIFMNNFWDSKRNLYIYVSDPMNIDEYVPFSEKLN